MLPVRLATILLTLFLLAFWAAPSSFAQRRVFTNDDFPQAAPPAPPAPAETTAPSAEGTPGEETAPSGVEEPQPDPNLPPILSASNDLQEALRRFYSEVVSEFEAEADLARQERLQAMMDLTRGLIVQTQTFIADLQARQEQAEADARAGAPPAPAP